ncbi:hypothetical protein NECAME_10090 [Necator americanus]|uniref:Uncharacterized protein n=1 Tax=Necator americanus TaxID=51031 RepID=W2T9Y7_NECAM|nr:hypothetical protein NECAME_10090 [Necator americanus]ETN78830.1 hypothetical protein NECAME_10090 [Necator americanus]
MLLLEWLSRIPGISRGEMTAHGDDLGPEKLDIQLTEFKKVESNGHIEDDEPEPIQLKYAHGLRHSD